MPSHVNRPFVYIAAPFRHTSPQINTRRAILVADELNATGIVTAFPPHLSILWDFVAAHTNEHWLDFDLAILARSDALYRLDGYSPGADDEIVFANERGIPVFYERDDLLEWARGLSEN